jgi:hypothetical protein
MKSLFFSAVASADPQVDIHPINKARTTPPEALEDEK